MKRTTFSVGSFEVNCTILHQNGEAWIVDPGGEPEKILGELRRLALKPRGILLTHAHFDHIGAVNAILAAAPGTPVYLGEKDIPVVSHPFNQMPPEYPPVAKIEGLRPASEVPLFQALDTPGHTPGGVSYYLADFDAGNGARGLLLSGDTLFAGSVGRTDFPGGNMATMMASLGSLKALPPETLVVPGHGPETTLAREFASNPFLAD